MRPGHLNVFDGLRMTTEHMNYLQGSFHSAVQDLRGILGLGLVHKGLEEARGNYKIVLRLFNMEARDYKRFLNFLRKHDCQLPFKEYRQ